MFILLASFALILVNLDIVVLLIVIILGGFPLRFDILVKVLLFIVLHMVSRVIV